MTDAKLCERLRALLDRMVECRRYPNEYREEAHDAAIDDWLDVERRAEYRTEPTMMSLGRYPTSPSPS